MEGSATLRLGIAGHVIGLETAGDGLRLRATGASARFVTEAEPDIRLTARVADLADDDPPVCAFDSGGVWRVFAEEGGWRFRLRSPVYGARPYREAWFSADGTRGEVRLRPDALPAVRTVYPLEYPLDELLMMLRLACGDGLEVHSCGVRDAQGRGLLFVGHSGAGKTTTARLWQAEPGATVLSDDRIVLRRQNDEWWMYGTPWHGDARLGEPEGCPLRAVLFIHHGERNELRPVRGARAAAGILSRCFPPYFDAGVMARVLERCEQLSGEIPFLDLYFRPEPEVCAFLARELPL